MRSSPGRLMLQYLAAWSAVVLQFWAAFLAPCRRDRRLATATAGPARHSLDWPCRATTLVADYHDPVTTSPSSCPEPLVSPRSVQRVRSFHPAHVFLTGGCDRRQLMSTKAPETKNDISSLRALIQLGTWLLTVNDQTSLDAAVVPIGTPAGRLAGHFRRSRPVGSQLVLLHSLHRV